MKKLIMPFVAVSLFFACQKNDALEPSTPSEDYTNEYNASANLSAEMVATQNVNYMVQEVMDSYAPNGRMDGTVSNTATYTYTPPCAVITPSAKDKSITIDFGTGCTTPMGGTYSGLIKITYTGKFGTSGSTINVDLTNFTTAKFTFNGTMTLSNFKLNSSTLSYDVAFTNMVVLNKDGNKSTINLKFSFAWTSGISTPKVATDDIFTLSVSGSYTDFTNKSYTVTTVTPLELKGSCDIKIIPTSGVLEVQTTASGVKTTVDFGDGTCDDIIYVSVKGVKKTVDLIP